jgi:Family of unknown function (DUF5675)
VEVIGIMSISSLKASIILVGILSVAPVRTADSTLTHGLKPNTVQCEITRIKTINSVIYGSLRLKDGSSVFKTYENEKYAIPVGTYRAYLGWSNKRHRLVPFLIVPKRTDIEIHASKNPLYLRGCIGVSPQDFDSLMHQLIPTQHDFDVVVSDAV